MADEARIDKWLWTVRIFKTRTLAAEACKKGRVKINDVEAKPSKDIKIGDIISVRKPPINYSYFVKGIPKNRVGAKLLVDFIEDTTPEDELQKLEPGFLAFQGYRQRGLGRPTKKERRLLDSIIDSDSNEWD
ncbi:MAG TPA: RNA-binding S4 domain-containing protein [Tenuifilaceae bacterium]|nr:RNA-binding S4 domain-containing protein [Tenuifilaceae bacterium]HPE19089.1 RNA-binding S4 domain-containing protein [Tenuifilaceae bacterium]HPJ46598.1 RNA-binding S4 domain-containing protein [Tenuifilaceae bacterium]HPQ34966.1 RNA-binding S4 domain-containing protein [Tenuifilaceae bacterium]HRX68756.1 RNA-binding S4 domain-containing protein [Tenuifilaceae bacterium]